MKELLQTKRKTWTPGKEFHAVLDHEKLASKQRVIFAFAHPDDEALAEGLNISLARSGVGVILVSFTDGGGRDLLNFTQDELIDRRRTEGVVSGIKSGAAMFVNLGYPDGELERYEYEALNSFSRLLHQVGPDAIVATNQFDPHSDHASVNRLARKAVSDDLSFYSTDTMTTRGRDGSLIQPTHVFSVSDEDKLLRDEAYLLHESQVQNLPSHEISDVMHVLDLPRTRGDQVGIRNAAILVQDSHTKGHDLIGDILSSDLITKII